MNRISLPVGTDNVSEKTVAMKKKLVNPSDIAFTSTVKAIQDRKGSRRAYAKMEENGGCDTTITPELAAFIAAQISVFLGTANAEGQPYIQHRGGPPGFLHAIRTCSEA